MGKIGIEVDYRDNLDPATSKYMKQVLSWTYEFLSKLLKHFDAKLYSLNSGLSVKIEDISSKRFLFTSIKTLVKNNGYTQLKDFILGERVFQAK